MTPEQAAQLGNVEKIVAATRTEQGQQAAALDRKLNDLTAKVDAGGITIDYAALAKALIAELSK